MKNDILPASVIERLDTEFMGRNIVYYPSVRSTMDVAKKMAQEGATEGTVIIADEQSAGRGRLGRRWLSPPGSSILLSIILRPRVELLPQLNMVASLAVVQGIEKVTGLKPAIKWPNDVLLSGKKVSGIIIENVFQGSKLNSAIVGIGINVELDPSSFPEIASIATSLSTELGKEMSRIEVLLWLLKEFEQLYKGLRLNKPIYDRWISYVETVGKSVQVKSGDIIEEGYVESINTDGSLMLRRPDGSLITMVAGEVTLHI